MIDYTPVLTEIANAVKTIAGAPNYWLIPPIAVLVSAGIGYWASQRTIAKHDKRQRIENEKKKRLVIHLLQDEIAKRWKEGIRLYLLTLRQETYRRPPPFGNNGNSPRRSFGLEIVE